MGVVNQCPYKDSGKDGTYAPWTRSWTENILRETYPKHQRQLNQLDECCEPAPMDQLALVLSRMMEVQAQRDEQNDRRQEQTRGGGKKQTRGRDSQGSRGRRWLNRGTKKRRME